MAVWPASLPQKLEQQGFTRSAGDNVRRTQVDQGPAFQAPKYSASPEPIPGSMVMTTEQVRTFLTFWNDDLANGAIPFDWIDPMFGTPAEVQFTDSYQITALSGEYYRVSLNLELHP